MTPQTVFSPAGSNPAAPLLDSQETIKAEFGRLIHAAIINKSFQKTLLSNPNRAIEDGFFGESFQIPGSLKEQIKMMRSKSLAEFSRQVLSMLEDMKQVEVSVSHYQ